MNEKYTVVNAIDINDEYSVIIVKKIKKPMKQCGKCEHFKYFGDLSLHYCDKYHGVVEKTDYCIEEGM